MSRFIPAVALWLLAGVARGESPLDVLVHEALEKNREIQAAQQAVLAARERPTQAQALADPMLSFAYVNDGWSPSLGQQEMTTLGVMASQDLPFPGKRKLRGRVLALEADQAQQQLERVRRRIVADLKREYFAALEARVLLALTGEQKTVWQQIEGVARARYSVGEGSQQEVLRAQIELTRFEQVQVRQEAEVSSRIAAVNTLLDRAPDSPLDLSDPPDEVPPTLAAATPEIESSRLGVQKAQAAYELAERNFKPDFSVQAGYMNRGGLEAMWQAGVGVRLPTGRSRLKAGLAEAAALKASEEARLAATLRLLEQRTHERRLLLDAARRSVQIYSKALIPQDHLSVESALASYRTGRIPFVAVLDALRTLWADNAALAGFVTSTRRLQVAIEEASLDAREDLRSAAMSAAGGPAAPGDGAAMGGSMGR